MISFLDFEKPIAELEGQLEDLRQLGGSADDATIDIKDDIRRLEDKVQALLKSTYESLTPWQKTQVARHPSRPHFERYVSGLITDYSPLCGDRVFGDDQAILGGLGRFRGRPVMVIGHERGHDTQSRMAHNFGMARPEGYRKAARLMLLADRFGLPIITFVDTPGAYPGIGAEERGQAEAIASAIETCLRVGVPLVACIVGEGGSGGAVALAAGDRIVMLEHSVYSVITPEGCASILWRSAEKAEDAAEAMKVTAQDLLQLGVIDRIVGEPVGGAHRDNDRAIADLGDAIEAMLEDIGDEASDTRRTARRDRFLAMSSAAAGTA